MKVNNKPMFIEWLDRFKKTVKDKDFKSISPYLGYIATIETHLKMALDEIYFSKTVPEIEVIEEKLKKKKSFIELKDHYQTSLLSGLHSYKEFNGRNASK